MSQFARSAVLDQVQAHCSAGPSVEEQLATLALTMQQAMQSIAELREESRKIAAHIEAQRKRDESL